MIYPRLTIFEKILKIMRKSGLLFLLGILMQTSFAQNVAVAKLRSETSRNIKKENDTSYYNWKQGGMYNFNLSQSSGRSEQVFYIYLFIYFPIFKKFLISEWLYL